jgi:hypothetical protein
LLLLLLLKVHGFCQQLFELLPVGHDVQVGSRWQGRQLAADIGRTACRPDNTMQGTGKRWCEWRTVLKRQVICWVSNRLAV